MDKHYVNIIKNWVLAHAQADSRFLPNYQHQSLAIVDMIDALEQGDKIKADLQSAIVEGMTSEMNKGW
jgi:hypothetical protein